MISSTPKLDERERRTSSMQEYIIVQTVLNFIVLSVHTLNRL
jgi:hypothetical protein